MDGGGGPLHDGGLAAHAAEEVEVAGLKGWGGGGWVEHGGEGAEDEAGS